MVHRFFAATLLIHYLLLLGLGTTATTYCHELDCGMPLPKWGRVLSMGGAMSKQQRYSWFEDPCFIRRQRRRRQPSAYPATPSLCSWCWQQRPSFAARRERGRCPLPRPRSREESKVTRQVDAETLTGRRQQQQRKFSMSVLALSSLSSPLSQDSCPPNHHDVTSSFETAAVDTTKGDNDHCETIEDNGGPYQRTFPRYRIDISPSPRRRHSNTNMKQRSSIIGNFLSSWATMKRTSLLPPKPEDQPSLLQPVIGNRRSPSSTSASSSQKLQQQRRRIQIEQQIKQQIKQEAADPSSILVLPVEWIESSSNETDELAQRVELMAALWKFASNDVIMAALAGTTGVAAAVSSDNQESSIHQEGSNGNIATIIALAIFDDPLTTRFEQQNRISVMQGWTELWQWMVKHETDFYSQQQEQTHNTPLTTGLIASSTAVYYDYKNLPCIRLQIKVPPLNRLPSSPDPPTHVNDSTIALMEKEVYIKRTQAWVKRVLVDRGICPFTKSVKYSGQGLSHVGVPVAQIAYHTSIGQHVSALMADTWQAMMDMVRAGPSGKSGISSILLAAPAWDNTLDAWTGPFFTLLEASVVAAGAEAALGVVCFHPRYATPDGTTWPGFGHMHSVPRLEQWCRECHPFSHPRDQKKLQDSTQFEQTTGTLSSPLTAASAALRDDIAAPAAAGDGGDDNCGSLPLLTTEQIAAGGAWQRRTPHATINVLRAEQLAAAESMRQTKQLYSNNIDLLANQIGCKTLIQELRHEQGLT